MTKKRWGRIISISCGGPAGQVPAVADCLFAVLPGFGNPGKGILYYSLYSDSDMERKGIVLLVMQASKAPTLEHELLKPYIVPLEAPDPSRGTSWDRGQSIPSFCFWCT